MNAPLQSLTADNLGAYEKLEELCFERPYSTGQIAEEFTRIDTKVLGGFRDHSLICALMLREIWDELWIFRISVHPMFRRKGLACVLLQSAKEEASRRKKELWLEVSAENLAALKLYEKAGFEKMGLRKNYYPANEPFEKPEDAVLMRFKNE